MVVIKEDSLDDIVPAGRSTYYDKVVELLKKFRIPIKCSGTMSGGRICTLNVGTDVVYKHPNTEAYVPLRYMEMYNDGEVYLSSHPYGNNGWHYVHVPIEEIWVKSKGSYRNIKGKVVKEITFSKSINFSA